MPLEVLIVQFSSPLLILFFITASLSYVLGQRIDAVIIGLIWPPAPSFMVQQQRPGAQLWALMITSLLSGTGKAMLMARWRGLSRRSI